MTKRLMFAAALLLCLGSAAMAKSPKTKITFGQGTTVTINGKPAKSGATIKPGDSVSVQGGKAELSVGGKKTELPAGSSVAVSADGAVSATGPGGASITVSVPPTPPTGGPAAAPLSDNSGSTPPPLSPPNPAQNQAVAPVSGSAP